MVTGATGSAAASTGRIVAVTVGVGVGVAVGEGVNVAVGEGVSVAAGVGGKERAMPVSVAAAIAV